MNGTPLSEEIEEAVAHLAAAGRAYVLRAPVQSFGRRQWARREWSRALDEMRGRLEYLAAEMERVLDPEGWSERRRDR